MWLKKEMGVAGRAWLSEHRARARVPLGGVAESGTVGVAKKKDEKSHLPVEWRGRLDFWAARLGGGSAWGLLGSGAARLGGGWLGWLAGWGGWLAWVAGWLGWLAGLGGWLARVVGLGRPAWGRLAGVAGSGGWFGWLAGWLG